MMEDPTLAHLQAELVCLDLEIQLQVRAWQAAGQDPGDAFRGLYITEQEARTLSARPFATDWGALAEIPEHEQAAYHQAREQAEGHRLSFLDSIHQSGQISRLKTLWDTFSLSRFDQQILLLCLAPLLDQRYERLYGFLQDDVTRRRPTIHLALTLFQQPGQGRLTALHRFHPQAPLINHRLLETQDQVGGERVTLLHQQLALDEALVAWILGGYRPTERLQPYAEMLQPGSTADGTIVSGSGTPLLEAGEAGETGGPITLLYGADRWRQDAAAASLASRAGSPLLRLDLEEAVREDADVRAVAALALRDTALTGAVLHLTGWETVLEPSSMVRHLYSRLDESTVRVVLSSQQRWLPQGLARRRPFRQVEVSVPGYPERLAIWEETMGHLGREASGSIDLAPLAGQFSLTAGQIRDAAASAQDRARQQGRPVTSTDLYAACRDHSNPNLRGLARQIVPRYDWQDLILPEDQRRLLQEIIATVRERPQVLDLWGLGEKLVASRGVTVLFAGPPGTGKTMAAEIIARQLQLDLFKIDLSTVVSKYIGETEKNLERIFNEAATSNAILFFDEADALFGKRSEVRDSHDRYANIEISYLLQRMEAYDGVTILATNLRANLDEAFTRRLQFAVDFPFPDEDDRLAIWQALFPSTLPTRGRLDFPLLARRFRLAGGSIRNIIVNAAYLASDDGGQVSMEHLLHGTRRELQKMGRLVDEGALTLAQDDRPTSGRDTGR